MMDYNRLHVYTDETSIEAMNTMNMPALLTYLVYRETINLLFCY